MKTLAYIVLVLIFFYLIVCLSSCKRNIPVSEKHYYHDSTFVKEKLVPVPIEGTQVINHINYDSITAILKGHINKTIVYTDKSNSTRLIYYLDSLTNTLDAKCETITKIHEAKVNEMTRVIESKDQYILKQHQSFGEKLESYFWTFILVIAGIEIFKVVISLIEKRKPSI